MNVPAGCVREKETACMRLSPAEGPFAVKQVLFEMAIKLVLRLSFILISDL